jgi:glutaredoxin
MSEVILYTRRDCGLCDEAAEELAALQHELGFALRTIDIDTDDELRERFNDVIPVVAVDERIVAQAPIPPGSLREALAGAIG